MRLRLVEVPATQIVAEQPIPPMKIIGDYTGSRILVLQAPGATQGTLDDLARQWRDASSHGSGQAIIAFVDRLEDLQEFQFEVPLPSADDQAAVQWFAEHVAEELGISRLAYPAARDAIEGQVRMYLRLLADWPGVKGGASA